MKRECQVIVVWLLLLFTATAPAEVRKGSKVPKAGLTTDRSLCASQSSLEQG